MDLNILLIEDDDDYIVIIKDLLQEADSNINVDAVTSFKSGLEKLKDNSYDCVLADYIIPGISGLDVMLNAREMKIDTPFILLTALGDNEFGKELVNKGAFDFLTKDNLSSKELIEKINRAIDHKNH